MKEPVEPNQDDCCNSGCNPCIFDVYEKQVLLFKKYLEQGEYPAELQTENAISQMKYTLFTVIENIHLCDDHQLIIFKVKTNSKTSRIHWDPGSHFLVKYTSGDNSCSRAYTPLKQRLKSTSEFSILVKRYRQGFVSQYLCDLKIGQETLWRGPYGFYEITPNKFERIIMIAQGTGIAPLFSIIEHILGNEDDMSKLILFYCCHSKELIVLREELYSWKQYWNFTYTIYLSNGKEDDDVKYQEPIVNSKLNTEELLTLMPCSARDQILLCGSVQFMQHYKEFFRSKNLENIILF